MTDHEFACVVGETDDEAPHAQGKRGVNTPMRASTVGERGEEVEEGGEVTDQEFDLGYMGDPVRTADGRRRIRSIVADELRNQAKLCRQAGRPDKASRLSWAAGQIVTGRPITKRVDQMIAKEREAARSALVDGVPLVDWGKEP